MRLALVVAALSASLTLVAARADPAPEPQHAVDDPKARALAEAWFDQLLGFDALEAYEVPFKSFRVAFVVARRWSGGTVQLVLDVVQPKMLDEVAALFLQNRDRSDDFFVYMTKQLFPGPLERKVRRFVAPRIDFSLPWGGLAIPLGEVRPFLPGELGGFRRLPDELVSGEPCRVVEADVRNERFQFDRIRLTLSESSGVALETRYFEGDRVLRGVFVDPTDVESHGGRMLPSRRRIETRVSRDSTELVLRNLMIDPVLPDRLFTSHSLHTQRFPHF